MAKPPQTPTGNPHHRSDRMLKPVWIGRFQVSGPRDNPHLAGHPAAALWVAAQADDEPALTNRVTLTMQQHGLTVTRADRLQIITDDAAQPFELRKLLRDARRNPDSVACGHFGGFEDHAGRRPMLLELSTERLLLRPWQPHDRDPFARMNTDRDVMNFLPRILSRRQSDDEVDQYLADFNNTGFGLLVAEIKLKPEKPAARALVRPTGAFAGIMGLRLMTDVLPHVSQPAIELVFRVDRPHQRQGFATEGGHALLNLAFNEFQLPEVVAVTPIANLPARGLLEKLGMRHRADLEFINPHLPARHLYARHTLYQLRNPN